MFYAKVETIEYRREASAGHLQTKIIVALINGRAEGMPTFELQAHRPAGPDPKPLTPGRGSQRQEANYQCK